MPIKVERVEYFTAADIHRQLRIARQTLWRWRRDQRIPLGRRYRGATLLFTRNEFDAIRDFANRLEPVKPPVRRRGTWRGRDAKPRRAVD